MGYKYQGKKLLMDKPFTDVNGTKYPKNWLRLSSEYDKAKVPGGAVTWEPD